MKNFTKRLGLFAGVLLYGTASAITITLDYTYDTNGFFNQTGSKEAMRAVADFFEERINDNLLEIDQDAFGSGVSWSARITHPGTGASQFISGLKVPEDTLIIYVGGRALGTAAGRAGPGGFSASGTTAWFDLLDARGQSGELDSPATDFGPWGGAITFDTGRTWHFQLDGRPTGSTSDFVSVALHEMGHVLGIGTSDSWDDQIDSSNNFIGPRSMASFGGAVPVDSAQGHWQNDGICMAPLGYDPTNPLNILSATYVSFGKEHGEDQIALMDPSSCTITSNTDLKVFTDLDLAALSDIGWEIFLPLELNNSELGPAGSTFSWPTSTGQSYSIERTSDLAASWQSISGTLSGDGESMTFSDSNPPSSQAFYRLADVSTVSSNLVATLPSEPANEDEGVAAESFATVHQDERYVENCGGSCYLSEH